MVHEGTGHMRQEDVRTDGQMTDELTGQSVTDVVIKLIFHSFIAVAERRRK